MNRNRLERLAGLLEDYRDREGSPAFDLGSWGRFVERRGGFLWLQKYPCDTAACAVGLACLSGEFRSEGLRYRRFMVPSEILPVFAGKVGLFAVQAFFDLTKKQAGHLFYVDSYRGPTLGEAGARCVATRIRKFIAPRKRAATQKSGAPKIFADMLLPEKPRTKVSDHQS